MAGRQRSCMFDGLLLFIPFVQVVPHVIEQLFHQNPGEFVQALIRSIPSITTNRPSRSSSISPSKRPDTAPREDNHLLEIDETYQLGLQLAAVAILADM